MSSDRAKSNYHAVRTDPRGLLPARFAKVTLEDHIKESLRALLLLQPGERLFHPNLGCGLSEFLFRPLTEGLKRDITTRILEQTAKQESRIQLLAVQVDSDPVEKSRLLIVLEYRIIQSQRLDSFRIAIQP